MAERAKADHLKRQQIEGAPLIGPPEVMLERIRIAERELELAARGETIEHPIALEPVWKTAQRMGIDMPKPVSTTPAQPPADDTSDLHDYDDL